YLFSKMELYILILGIDKAEKITLLERMKSVYSNIESLPPDRIVPTVGLNVGRIEVANRKLRKKELKEKEETIPYLDNDEFEELLPRPPPPAVHNAE
ncbi:hypothetical protein S245_025493, partial [Arachis hypogaea]